MYAILAEEAKWIIAHNQLSSGAVITCYPGRPRIVPYFAHLALYGVVEAGGYKERVGAYLDWYMAHLEKPDRYGLYGTVYDYTVADDGTEIPEQSYDSSDSYGATFLTLLWRYFRATGEPDWLLTHKEDLEMVARAVLATRQDDGLTLARPDWPVKYLMDNCEVYEGLLNYAALLETVWGEEAKASFYRQAALKIKEALQRKMWTGEGYCPAVYRWGWRRRPHWKKWYPDVLAQFFPLICGVLEPRSPEAAVIYRAFLRNYPNWHIVSSSSDFTSPLIAWAAALMGDEKRLSIYFREIAEKVIARGHPWPWHAAEAGILILAGKAYLE